MIDYYGQAERVAFAYSTEPGQYFFHAGYGKVELQRDAAGAELWAFRDRQPPHHWFLHGVFG